MEEWKECKLGEIATITKLAGFEFTKYIKYNETGEIIALRALNLRNGRLDLTEVKHIDKSVSDALPRSKLYKGEILFTYTGNGYGDCALVDEDDKYHLAPNICKISPNKKIADSNFLFQTIRSNAFYKQVSNYIGGSSQPTIPMETIRQLKVKLPPLPTQQKIAAILSSLDDKIELNNKINTNLEQQAQALFDEMFKDYEKDILLGDVIETTSGGTPSRKNMAFYTNGNNCWVKSKELESGFIIDTEEKITDDAINNSAAKLLPKNSVLIAMYGATVGAYGIISKPMTCNQAICALLPNENYPYTYLFMFAKNVTQELENLAIGSAQQNISQVLIKKLKVHSDTNKIKEFHSSTHALFEQMLLIRQENKTLSELRDSLLPKLMNGEIEVGIK